MILKLAYKNVISRRSSIVIILFIAFAITLLCVANAVFDSTEQGVQSNYISSFTGDLYIRPSEKLQLSLFGDETPVTGELTSIDCLRPYSEIKDYLMSLPYVTHAVGQVSGMTAMECGGTRVPIYLFGVNGDEYIQAMNSIHVLEGKPFSQGERGVMFSKSTAQKYGVHIGDIIQFVVADGPYVRIRAAPLTAIFDYELYNDIFDRFVLSDSDTARSLFDISDSSGDEEIYISEDSMSLLDQDMDLDSLFDDAFDTEVFEETPVVEEEPELPLLEQNESENESIYIPSTSWNFIVVRLMPGVSWKKTIKKLNREFKKRAWPVQAMDWRHAAGSTALYLYWMRIIFNAGIIIVLAAGFIIINNTLVINVLDRTQEIGTMRAVGAKKRYISLECMIETFMLTVTSGVIGILLGMWCCHLITKAHIVLHNSFLVQLFGGDALVIAVTGPNILKMVILSVLLGLLGWVYPVINAVKISPVRAMQGAR